MELHSYAKLRGYKKWTIQQKRKLVEARINYDGIFSKKSSNCVDSWKKIMNTAKLNEFNVCFVRKQWANLLAKYKVYKRTRLRQLGKNGEINDQIAREISEEWEFFYPIHSFMSKKPTNFHSYAQNPRDADENGNAHRDEDYKSEFKSSPPFPQNTDHDFYSKSASREIQDIKMEPNESSTSNINTPAAAAATSSAKPSENNNKILGHNSCSTLNSNSIQIEKPQKIVQAENSAKKTPKKRKPSERDKYYKHKRRYDRRNERRFDALLNVFGQMVKTYFPNVDTTKLDAQSDQISTEDDNESSMSETVCMEEDLESFCSEQSSAEPPVSDESGL